MATTGSGKTSKVSIAFPLIDAKGGSISTMTIRGLDSQTNLASGELRSIVQVLDHLHFCTNFTDSEETFKYPCERLDSRLVSGADYNNSEDEETSKAQGSSE